MNKEAARNAGHASQPNLDSHKTTYPGFSGFAWNSQYTNTPG